MMLHVCSKLALPERSSAFRQFLPSRSLSCYYYSASISIEISLKSSKYLNHTSSLGKMYPIQCQRREACFPDAGRGTYPSPAYMSDMIAHSPRGAFGC
jgi:hypothetical protein